MEDIFDSLIYIIIALVGFVISALGKKKKRDAKKIVPKPSQEPTKPKARPFMSNLEQLLNEELGITNEEPEITYEEERPNKEYEPVLDSPVSSIDRVEDALDSVPEEMLDEKEDIPYSVEYDKTNEILKHSIGNEDEEDLDDVKPVMEDFNLRDAVIYSEIINRKEY